MGPKGGLELFWAQSGCTWVHRPYFFHQISAQTDHGKVVEMPEAPQTAQFGGFTGGYDVPGPVWGQDGSPGAKWPKIAILGQF